MKTHVVSRLVLAALASAIALPALAHPGHDLAFTAAAGFAHPFLGVDHLAMMVIVGLAALTLSPGREWLTPAAFLAGLAGGALLQVSGLAIPFYEAGILVSLVALGALVASGLAAPMVAVAPALALFGVMHGAAHAAEAPAGGFALYLLGFVAASAVLHGLGLAAQRFQTGPAVRFAGGAVAMLGLALAVAGG